MVGQTRLLAFSVTAVCLLCRVAPLAAQDNSRPPSLSERLEQLRQDLLGDEKPAPRRQAAPEQNFSADRKVNNAARPAVSSPEPMPIRQPVPQPNNRPANVAPNNAQQANRVPTPAKAPAATQPGMAGPARPKLEPQTARKAQGGGGAVSHNPLGMEPVAQDFSDGLTPLRRPTPRQELVEPTPIAETSESSEPEPRVANVPQHAPQHAPPVNEPVEVEAEQPRRLRPARENATAQNGGSPGQHSGQTGVLFTAQSPVIAVETTGPRKVMIGKEAIFVVKVRNTGATANNVVVSMNVPSDVELAGTEATAGSIHAGMPGERREPLEWKIPRLDARSSETLNLKIVPRKSSPLDLAVQWTFTPDSSQTLIEVQEPKLAMTINGPEEVQFGQSKIYKLTVSNPGNGDTENVVVALLPIGRVSDGIASHRMGTLRAGETRAIDIELTARQAGALAIKAQAYADGGLRTEAAVAVLVRRASLRVDVESPKVKYAGTLSTYRVRVTNAGDATADNVQVSAMLPPDAKFINCNGGGRFDPQQGKVHWTLGNMQQGIERVFELQCSLTTPGDNRIQFVSIAEGDLSAAATTSTRVEALADLKLEVRDPQGPIPVGEDAVYEVHIRNRGTKAATEVDLTVFFSDGLEAVSVEGGGHEIASGQVTFRPITAIGAGETVVFRVRARAERGGNHVFRAELHCQTLSTKLAAEEATLFYGDDHLTARARPTPLSPFHDGSESDEPRGLVPFEPVGDDSN